MPDELIKQMIRVKMDKVMKNIPLIHANIGAQLEALTLPYKRIQAVMDSFSARTQMIFEVLKNIDGDGFEEFYEEFRWIESLPLPYAMELKDKLKEGRKEAVWDEFIKDFKNDEVIKEILEQVNKNKLISKREHIISTAITHHKNGDYISSIPLLLSQIEGVLWDYGVEKNKIKNEFNSRTIIDGNGKEILDENTKKPKQANLQLLLTLVFEGKSKFKEQLRDNVYTPNFRNPILHGREISYADEQRSVWLLLLLFTLIGKTKR